jgi:hypothetical protein
LLSHNDNAIAVVGQIKLTEYIPPTWARTGCPDTDIVKDMDSGLDNMLTLAEDLLVGVVMNKSKSAKLISER